MWVDTWDRSVAILFWQLSIDHILNVKYKRCGFAKTHLRHPSLLLIVSPTPTVQFVDAYVRSYARSITWQPNERGWPYSMTMGLCPKPASRGWEPRYYIRSTLSTCFTQHPSKSERTTTCVINRRHCASTAISTGDGRTWIWNEKLSY